MNDAPVNRATDTLLASADGSARAADELFEQVYAELRALAGSYLRRESPDWTLGATALVHEAYLRMIDQTRTDWRGRAHFFAVAAQAIRRVLVDHARRRKAAKRGGGARAAPAQTLADAAEPEPLPPVDLLALDEALDKLESLNARHARVVQLRFFGGLGLAECAEVLGVARSTVSEDWGAARAWLAAELDEAPA